MLTKNPIGMIAGTALSGTFEVELFFLGSLAALAASNITVARRSFARPRRAAEFRTRVAIVNG
jgi:hypothetical protein